MTRVAAIVPAAGAGRRYGMPKVLARDPDGAAWVATVTTTLRSAGVDPVIVVLGAAVEEAKPLIPDGVRVAVTDGWERGLSASLRAGLCEAAADSGIDAVLIALVDQPELPVAVLDLILRPPVGRNTLRRMTYHGKPGHPVLIGRRHWRDLADTLHGDAGAGPWLTRRAVETIAGDSWWDGADHDVPRPARQAPPTDPSVDAGALDAQSGPRQVRNGGEWEG